MITEPVILYFADGSTRKICERGDFLLPLFQGAFGGEDLSPTQAAQRNLIRRSVGAQEPGGGHMVELLRSLLNGPAEEPANR